MPNASKLNEARWEDLIGASGMNSNAKGRARVRKMISQTLELRMAQHEYGSFLRSAQNEGAISDENQW